MANFNCLQNNNNNALNIPSRPTLSREQSPQAAMSSRPNSMNTTFSMFPDL